MQKKAKKYDIALAKMKLIKLLFWIEKQKEFGVPKKKLVKKVA